MQWASANIDYINPANRKSNRRNQPAFPTPDEIVEKLPPETEIFMINGSERQQSG
jgi:hypothetical protein